LKGMQNVLESKRSALTSDKEECRFVNQAMHLRILFPDKISEFNLDDITWEGMKDQLDTHRNNNHWKYFADHARCLKILAADEIEVTDQGLKVVMSKKDFKQEKSKRPVRKNF